MNDIVRVDHVFDYNDSLGCETLHPLVSVIDFSEELAVWLHPTC